MPDGIADAAGTCHTETWCEGNATAAKDCGNLFHIAVPNTWSCDEFQCAWQTSGPLPVCGYDDPTKSYLGTSTQQCAVIRYTCVPWRQSFSDPCGCACPQVIDYEGGTCDQDAIRQDCPDSVIAL